MKNNIKLKLQTTTRMILFGASLFVIMLALGWLFYMNLGAPDKATADDLGPNGPYTGEEYVENENATEFEVAEFKLRSPQDPVFRGTQVTKTAVLAPNQN